jgi:hypothetical protein
MKFVTNTTFYVQSLCQKTRTSSLRILLRTARYENPDCTVYYDAVTLAVGKDLC